MLPKILGFAGRKRSGKDTAAQAVEADAFAFATPIKLMLRALLEYQGADDDLIERMLEGDLKEVPSEMLGGRSPRYALQRLGTEWGRQQMCDSFWVDICLRLAEQAPRAVITDVRFPNEVAAIRARGGKVWRIERPDRPVGEGEEHSSEVLIDTLDVDRVVVNDGTIEALHDQITNVQ